VTNSFTTNRPPLEPGSTHTLVPSVGPQNDGFVVPVPGQPFTVVVLNVHEYVSPDTGGITCAEYVTPPLSPQTRSGPITLHVKFVVTRGPPDV
jgi:hypothetical protein